MHFCVSGANTIAPERSEGLEPVGEIGDAQHDPAGHQRRTNGRRLTSRRERERGSVADPANAPAAPTEGRAHRGSHPERWVAPHRSDRRERRRDGKRKPDRREGKKDRAGGATDRREGAEPARNTAVP